MKIYSIHVDGVPIKYSVFLHTHTFSGPLRVDIINRKGEIISRFPTHSNHNAIKKLEIELKIVWHDGKIICIITVPQCLTFLKLLCVELFG